MSPLVPAKIEKVIEQLPNYEKLDKKIFIGDQWIRLGMYSWEVPLDSSNIDLKDWKKMAIVIKDAYEDYEGFIILHGTDTLAYTASALSFMLENLNKPVIVTGSQLPIGKTRSDAVQNLVTSIEIAAAKSLNSKISAFEPPANNGKMGRPIPHEAPNSNKTYLDSMLFIETIPNKSSV
ncbi:Asparaginase/glutaminase [Candidatus Magnetomorum sp. HK-1]|nr:Asparaginase/glutaminase [Candidatus Magnetomorum sp. HK-1]